MPGGVVLARVVRAARGRNRVSTRIICIIRVPCIRRCRGGWARRGKVYLRVRVEPDGRPSQVEIKTSSGSVRLDQAAEDAVRCWRFIPAKRGDEAVSAWVVVPISFNLKQ